MNAVTARERAGERLKIKVISRCLGEIYGYIPATGDYYSSVNRGASPGITVRSRKPAYVWGEYLEGCSRLIFQVSQKIRGGELSDGRVELAGHYCRFDAAQGVYMTDIDMVGRDGEFYFPSASEALGALVCGADEAMRRRIRGYEERRRAAK